MANRKLNEPVQVIHGKTEYLAWIKEIIAPGVYKAQWDSLTGEKGQFTLYENQIVVIPPGGRRGSKRTMSGAAAPSQPTARPKKRVRTSSATASLEAAAATMPDAAAPSPRPKKRARESSATATGSLEAEAATMQRLVQVLGADQILEINAPKCQNDKCDRKACSKWKIGRIEHWFSCLDCQER
jgi:hypothetical protein